MTNRQTTTFGLLELLSAAKNVPGPPPTLMFTYGSIKPHKTDDLHFVDKHPRQDNLFTPLLSTMWMRRQYIAAFSAFYKLVKHGLHVWSWVL